MFARGEIVEGIAMLGGSIAGGVGRTGNQSGYALSPACAEFSSSPLRRRSRLMHDIGFTPRVAHGVQFKEIKNVLRDSIANGLAKRPVRWVMLTGPFTGGVTDPMRSMRCSPICWSLWGDERAFGIAGLAAAAVAGAQIAGGLLVPHLKLVFGRRTRMWSAPGSRRWRSRSGGWRSASACQRTRCWGNVRRCKRTHKVLQMTSAVRRAIVVLVRREIAAREHGPLEFAAELLAMREKRREARRARRSEHHAEFLVRKAHRCDQRLVLDEQDLVDNPPQR